MASTRNMAKSSHTLYSHQATPYTYVTNNQVPLKIQMTEEILSTCNNGPYKHMYKNKLVIFC